MMPDWLVTDVSGAGIAVLSAAGIYLAVILFTRVAGLRSFSKMSSFDFAMTVAIGSIMASTVLSRDTSLLVGVVGLAALFGLQDLVARLRVLLPAFGGMVDNRPVLLMKDGHMLEQAMKEAEVTRGDLLAKLREANVLDLAHARAVILETTGDISVLHGPPDQGTLDETLLEGVRGA
ncbi:MAG: DUF421 domain-containing protein [Gemmatimonadota bacterium]|jgi:uncharacterized membrane protein YcaP (DUF421 family)